MFLLITLTLLYSLASADPQAPLGYNGCQYGNLLAQGSLNTPGCSFYNGAYWVYAVDNNSPDATIEFSSPDLVSWTEHGKVLNMTDFQWAGRSLYPPSPVSRDNKYYLYFSATDYPRSLIPPADLKSKFSGIGVGVADQPEGPYRNPLANLAPLIAGNNSYPLATDGPTVLLDNIQAYLYYGSQGSLTVRQLADNMTSFKDDDHKLIQPLGYYEGATAFKRNDLYYLIWSEGLLFQLQGTNFPPSIRYAVATGPVGPFYEGGKILIPNPVLATVSQAGVIQVHNDDIWYIVYGRQFRSHSGSISLNGLAYERIEFEDDGSIKPVQMRIESNFDNPYNVQCLQGWLSYGATLSVDFYHPGNGWLLIEASEAGRVILPTNHKTMQYDINIEIDRSDELGADAGVIFRGERDRLDVGGDDDYEGYSVGVHLDGEIILGMVNGVFNMLNSTHMGTYFGSTMQHSMRITTQGSDITIVVDGQTMIQHSDSTYSSGWTGLRVHRTSAKFDNLTILDSPDPDRALKPKGPGTVVRAMAEK